MNVNSYKKQNLYKILQKEVFVLHSIVPIYRVFSPFILVSSCLFVTTVRTYNSSYILNGNSSDAFRCIFYHERIVLGPILKFDECLEKAKRMTDDSPVTAVQQNVCRLLNNNQNEYSKWQIPNECRISHQIISLADDKTDNSTNTKITWSVMMIGIYRLCQHVILDNIS